MNIKKGLKILPLVISGLVLSSTANAERLMFDLDGSAATDSTDGFAFTDTVIFTELQLDASSDYNIQQNLGADDILGDGDTFVETFRLNLLSAQDGGTTTAGYAFGSFVLGYVDVALSGFIDNYSDGGDGPTTAAGGNIGNDVFDINVVAGTLDFFYDPDFSQDSGDEVNYASGTGVTGGATQFSFENTTATQAIGIEFSLTSLLSGYLFDLGGTDLDSLVTLNLVAGLGDGSVNLLGVTADTSGGTGNNFLSLNVADNGTTLQFNRNVPEPSSIALLGLGLLGLSFVGRRNRRIV